MALADAKLEAEVGAQAWRIQAMVDRDMAGLDLVLADDMRYCHASGRIDSKASFKELVADPTKHYISCEYADTVVRDLGGRAASVGGRANFCVLQPNGQALSYWVTFLDVYERLTGWQMVDWHASRLAD